MRMNHQQTILFVEDDPNDEIFILEACRVNQFTNPIRVLCNGVEAVAYLQGKAPYADRNRFPYPGLLITDLKMPFGDGFTVLEYLKGNPHRAIVPTIILSASADRSDIRTAYELGATSFHVKPQTFQELVHQLRLLYDYWQTVAVPDVDETGQRLNTSSGGKMGERFNTE